MVAVAIVSMGNTNHVAKKVVAAVHIVSMGNKKHNATKAARLVVRNKAAALTLSAAAAHHQHPLQMLS